jgi:hypothetical protein
MKATVFRTMFAVLAILAFAGTPCQGAEKAKWTLMCYLAADNDLETSMMADLREMLAAGSNKDVSVIVLAKRSPKKAPTDKYTDKAIANIADWSTAKLLFVEKDKLREIEDWGNADSGSPETLKKFILAAAAACPAERYGLIMSDHGMSWPGLCCDETAGDSFLTTSGLKGVLAETTKTTGPLEMLGFDACMMANLEVACTISPYAKYLVASEELEPGDGWSYTKLIQGLQQKPDANGAELGRIIADSYKQYFDGSDKKHIQRAGMGITLSVCSLDKVAAIEAAVKKLAHDCAASIDAQGHPAFLATAQARAKAERYGGEQNELSVMDVANLASLLKKTGGDQVKASAAAVETAVAAAVTYKIFGKARPRSTGLSIFFPENPLLLQLAQPLHYQDLAFGAEAGWEPMLQKYCALSAADTTAPDVGDAQCADHDVEENTSITVTAEVNGDDVEEACFILSRKVGDDHIVIGQIPVEPDEKGKLSKKWDGKWFTLEDGEKKLICPITGMEEVDDAEDEYFVEVPAQIMPEGEDEWTQVNLYFYIDFNADDLTGEFVYAFTDTKHGPREVDIDTGDKIRPVYVKIDANEKETLVASEDKDLIITVDDVESLAVKQDKIPKGKYVVGFTVTDYAGNNDATFTDVDIK